MTERIFQLAVAVTPERIKHWHGNLSTGLDGALNDGIDILDILGGELPVSY